MPTCMVNVHDTGNTLLITAQYWEKFVLITGRGEEWLFLSIPSCSLTFARIPLNVRILCFHVFVLRICVPQCKEGGAWDHRQQDFKLMKHFIKLY